MAIVLDNIKRLLDERANIWETEGKPLADIADTRDFTVDEHEKFERLKGVYAGYSERIKALELSLEQERAVQQFADALKDEPAVRAAFETELRSVLVEREKTHVSFDFSGKDMKRALSVTGGSSGSAGGATAAPEFLAELIRPLRNFASVLNAGARIITTSTGTDLTIPVLLTPGAAATTAESSAIGGTDPTFGQKLLKSYRHDQLIKISRELIEDSAVDIEALVASLIGENIGARLGQKLSVGAGTTETAGLITASTVGKTGATGVTGAFTFDDLIDLHYSVAAPYRVNGSWLFADSALATARKIKSTVDGQYIWSPSVQVGQPDLILGKPVYTDAYMDAPGLSKKTVGFGDVSRYWVRFVNSLSIERSDQFAFNTGEVAFRGVLRADGLLTDASAFKVFQGGAS